MKRFFMILLMLSLIFTFCCCNEKTTNTPEPTIPNCGGPLIPEGKITLSYDTSKLSDSKKIDAYIEAYTEKYPEVTVIKDYSPGNIDARIKSGEIGDVFYLQDTDLYNYAVSQKALMPLNQFLEPLSADYLSVHEDVLDSCALNGLLYMVPTKYNRIAMIYNKTAVTSEGLNPPKNGWTWRDFEYYCQRLTKKENGKYTQVGGYLNYTWEPVYMSFLEGWGDTWFDYEKSRVTLSNYGVEELLELADSGVIKPEGKSDLSAYEELKDTDYVFRTVTYDDLGKYSIQYEEEKLSWDVVSFPAMPVHTLGADFSGLGVYRFTNNPNTAVSLALFAFEKEGQNVLCREPFAVPFNKKVTETDIWKYDLSKNMEAFIYGYDKNIVTAPEAKVPSEVAAVISNCWESLPCEYFSKGDFNTALKSAENIANKKWAKVNASLG